MMVAAPGEGFAPASLGRRAGAAFIDVAVLIGAIFVGLTAIAMVTNPRTLPHDPHDPRVLVFAALELAILALPIPAYFLLCWSRPNGRTVGMSALSLTLVSRDGSRPTGGQLLLRLAGAFWSTLLLLVGFAWAGFTRERTTWHDLLSGTRVEYRPDAAVVWAYGGWQPPPYPAAPGYPPGYGSSPGHPGPPPWPHPPGQPWPPGGMVYPAPPPAGVQSPPPSGAPPAELPATVMVVGATPEAADMHRGWRSTRTAARSPWNWTDVLLLLVLFIPALHFTGVAVSAFRHVIQPSLPISRVGAVEVVVLELLSYTGVVVLLALIVRIRRGAHLADLGLGQVSWRWLVATPPALVGAYALAGIANALSQAVFPGTHNNQCTTIRSEFGDAWWAAVIVVAIAAPVVEETFFRGFVLRYLRDRMHVSVALVASAAIFSAAHFMWSQPTLFGPIFMTGLALGTLYLYSGSIWPGVLLHAGNNLVATVVVLAGQTHC